MARSRALLAGIALSGAAWAQTPVPQQPVYDYSIATPLPGRWTYAATANGSAASFADVSTRQLLTMTCVRSTRRISIARPAVGAAPTMMVWTSAERRSVAASFNATIGTISAEVQAYDKLFDSMAFSRGRIAVGPSNAGALVAPASPEIIRVIEDCRS